MVIDSCSLQYIIFSRNPSSLHIGPRPNESLLHMLSNSYYIYFVLKKHGTLLTLVLGVCVCVCVCDTVCVCYSGELCGGMEQCPAVVSVLFARCLRCILLVKHNVRWPCNMVAVVLAWLYVARHIGFHLAGGRLVGESSSEAFDCSTHMRCWGGRWQGDGWRGCDGFCRIDNVHSVHHSRASASHTPLIAAELAEICMLIGIYTRVSSC